jgi:hypothetical protein
VFPIVAFETISTVKKPAAIIATSMMTLPVSANWRVRLNGAGLRIRPSNPVGDTHSDIVAPNALRYRVKVLKGKFSCNRPLLGRGWTFVPMRIAAWKQCQRLMAYPTIIGL